MFRRTLPFIVVVGVLMAVVILATDLWVAGSREAQAGLLPSSAREAIRGAGQGTSPSEVGSGALSALIFQNNVQVAFLAFALAIWRRYSHALARRTFAYSIAYLAMLFAALMVDHYLPLVAN